MLFYSDGESVTSPVESRLLSTIPIAIRPTCKLLCRVPVLIHAEDMLGKSNIHFTERTP